MDSKKQGEFETLKIHYAFLKDLLLQRSSFLVIVASISIALLVVFSLDDSLIVLSGAEFKILITVLLLIVLVTLISYVLEIHFAINKTVDSIEKLYGEKVIKKSTGKEILDSIITNIPLFAAVLVSLVIGYILCSMWWFN